MDVAGRAGWRGWLLRGAVALVALFAMIQAVPYGHSDSNPPVLAEPRWDSPTTRSLAATACFDCHSNLTGWRWYTNIAPMSWLAQRDIDGHSRSTESQPIESRRLNAVDLVRTSRRPRYAWGSPGQGRPSTQPCHESMAIHALTRGSRLR